MQMSINKSPAWYFIVQTILPTQILWYSVAYRQTGWTIFVVIQRKKIVNILTKIFFSSVFSTLYSLKIDLSCRAKVAGTWKNPRHPPLFVFVLLTHYVFIESEMTCHSNSYFSWLSWDVVVLKPQWLLLQNSLNKWKCICIPPRNLLFVKKNTD